MNKRFLISLMVAIFCLVVVAVPVPVNAFTTNEFGGTDYAGGAYVNVTTPAHGDEYYSTGPFNLSVTTFTFMENCTGYLYNGTGIMAGTNVSTLVLKSAANTSWTNNTFLDFAVSNGGANRWLVVKCMNTTTTNDTYWSNTTSAPNTGIFTINEFVDYSVANASVISITPTKFSNETVYSSMPGVNITLNETAATCYWKNETDSATIADFQTLTNNSGSRMYHGNSSASAAPAADSPWGIYFNATFYCEDAYGNKTFLNSTGYNVTSGAINSTSDWLWWKYDTTAPTFASDSWAIANATTGGNYINLTFNVTDMTPVSCGALVVFQDNSDTQVTGGSINTSAEHGFCFVNITPSDMTVQGNMTVYGYAIDGASTMGNSTTTREFILYDLSADDWNMITLYQNMTLQQIGGLYTNITYVSIWNNPSSYKNFTTYTVGTATNALIMINGTVNATYLYVNEDIKIVKRYQIAPAAWLQNTTSVHTEGWNIIGLDRGNFTINDTIYMTTTIADDEEHTKTVGNISLFNMTFFSYYNHTLGRYCGSYVGYTAYSCPGNVTNVYLPSGAAVWVQTNKNVSINISSRGDS